MPVVGLILYLLWGGDTQRKRLQRQTVPKLPPEEPESLRNRSALNADRLQRALPSWSRVSQYLSSRGFYLYQNTKAVYLPEGALLLEDLLGRIKAAERFIFMEYFILAEGKLWDRMSAALCERARSGVEVKIIFDDFGNIKRFSAESLQDAARRGRGGHRLQPRAPSMSTASISITATTARSRSSTARPPTPAA